MSEAFYFSDLKPEAQAKFLKAQGLASASDGNYDMDIIPIFELECSEAEE